MLEYRRRLPHFQPDDVYVFLTWRLCGSLPANRQRATYPTAGHAFVATDRALDCHRSGPLWLKDPRIAALVVKAIRIGESDKLFYELCAWVVMPNHVHLLIQPKADLPVITRWLKGSTARGANQMLERTGQPFWQDESYDHWARDAKEFVRICRCIEDNPVTAGLAGSAELWPWSSAGSR
jgi:REP element-mobilizing transposase RayT